MLRYLEEKGMLHHKGENWYWTQDAYPAEKVSLRSASEDNFLVVDMTKRRVGETRLREEVIAEVDFTGAHTTLYEGAVYLCESEIYTVEKLDYPNRRAYVKKMEGDYNTDAIDYTDVSVLEEFEKRPEEAVISEHGEVKVATRIVGYKKIKFYTLENLGYGKIELPDPPPEEVWSYEVGAKTEWLDRRLRANLALFLMDYKDLQLFRLDRQLRLETFTRDAKNQGAELELTAAPLEGLTLGLSGAYLKAEVDGSPEDGGQLPRSPEYTLGGFAEYGLPDPGGEFTVRAGAKWTDDYRTEIPYAGDEPNWRVTEIQSYTLVDARAAYSLTDSGLEFAVWGKNLTDEEYPMHIIPFLGNGFSIFAPPRTYGVSVSWKTR